MLLQLKTVCLSPFGLSFRVYLLRACNTHASLGTMDNRKDPQDSTITATMGFLALDSGPQPQSPARRGKKKNKKKRNHQSSSSKSEGTQPPSAGPSTTTDPHPHPTEPAPESASKPASKKSRKNRRKGKAAAVDSAVGLTKTEGSLSRRSPLIQSLFSPYCIHLHSSARFSWSI